MALHDLHEGDVLDRRGELIGHISRYGIVTDWSGGYVGCVRVDGAVLDFNDDQIGSVDKKNKLRDWRGTVIGQVRADGVVLDWGQQDVGSVIGVSPRLAGGAGILLLILRVVRTTRQ
jgi:hypothetical protein